MDYCQRRVAGVRPFEAVHRAERRVDREGLGAAQAVFEWVGFTAKCVHIARDGALGGRLSKHVRIAGIEALDSGAFVAGGEGRYEVVAKTNQKDVAPKRRTVLLADDYLEVGITL